MARFLGKERSTSGENQSLRKAILLKLAEFLGGKVPAQKIVEVVVLEPDPETDVATLLAARIDRDESLTEQVDPRIMALAKAAWQENNAEPFETADPLTVAAMIQLVQLRISLGQLPEFADESDPTHPARVN